LIFGCRVAGAVSLACCQVFILENALEPRIEWKTQMTNELKNPHAHHSGELNVNA
jgi:hypothetical protein